MMRKILFLLLFVLFASPVLAQDFGLQDGDDVVMDAPAANATIVQEPAPKVAEAPAEPSKPVLVLAAPHRVAIGQPFLVRLTSSEPLEEVGVHWMGKDVVPSISVWNDKNIALAMLGSDVLKSKSGKEKLVITARINGEDKAFERTIVIAPKKYPRQELTLPPKMVTPPKETLARIAEERKIIGEALVINSAQRLWRLPMLRPVPGKITSDYGLQRVLNGKPRNPHRGLDFRAPMGSPIKAIADGKVILVGDHYYAGRSVYLDHGNGVISMYFHMSEPKVKEGDFVQRGDVVGLAGKTGRATGPHLHMSISILGQLVDPIPLFNASGGGDSLLK